MEVTPTLEQDIRKGQLEDEKVKQIKLLMESGKASNFSVDGQGTLWLGKRIVVPDLRPIKELILREAEGETTVTEDYTKFALE